MLLDEHLLGPVLHELASNASLQSLVKGLLVQRNASAGANPLPAFPHQELSPYPPGDYPWNPRGQDLQGLDLSSPAFLLSSTSEAAALRLAAKNSRQVATHTFML